MVDTAREQRRNTVVQSGVFKIALASMESACLRPCSAAVAASAITAGTRWKSAKPILAVCKRRSEPQVVFPEPCPRLDSPLPVPTGTGTGRILDGKITGASSYTYRMLLFATRVHSIAGILATSSKITCTRYESSRRYLGPEPEIYVCGPIPGDEV